MLRSELVAELLKHRDNDVRVYIPTEDSGAYLLRVEAVAYYPPDDVLLIDTSVLIEEDPNDVA